MASVLPLVVCADLADGEDSPDCAADSALSPLKNTAGEERSGVLPPGHRRAGRSWSSGQAPGLWALVLSNTGLRFLVVRCDTIRSSS